MARLERRMSQRELAANAGTSQATISAYETGEKSPSLDTLHRIIQAAGLDLRIQVVPNDDHDRWLAEYERSLPKSVIAKTRRQDAGLVMKARSERRHRKTVTG